MSLPYVNSFRDLVVYQKSRALQRAVFEISKTFPREEMYSLTDQIRRASRSIGAQMAEAWAKRRYEKHFISKLTDSHGEELETEHWIETAFDDGYIDQEVHASLLAQAEEVGRLLNGVMRKSSNFCNSDGPFVSEEDSEFTELFVSQETPRREKTKY